MKTGRPGKPVTAGHVRYPSITALRNAVESSIDAGTIDLELAQGLFARHPYYAALHGGGVVAVTIERRSIVLTRANGSRLVLNKNRCIDESEQQRAMQACRESVFESVQAWRAVLFAPGSDPRCAVSGQSLSPDTGDADHDGPLTFAVLANAFLQHRGPQLTRAKSSDIDSPVFVDPAVGVAFREFHDKHATLRLVHRDINRGPWRRRS